MTSLPCLVGDSASGKKKIWTIEVIELKDKTGKIVVSHGYEGMKMTSSEKIISEGKNKGKKNETSAIQQAYLEARSAWKKKKDSGYVDFINMTRDMEDLYIFEFKNEDIVRNKFLIELTNRYDKYRSERPSL